MNPGIFGTNGTYDNKGAANISGPNNEPIGLNYIQRWAELFGDTLVQKSPNSRYWAAREQDSSRLRIHQLLSKESDSLHQIERTVSALKGGWVW